MDPQLSDDSILGLAVRAYPNGDWYQLDIGTQDAWRMMLRRMVPVLVDEIEDSITAEVIGWIGEQLIKDLVDIDQITMVDVRRAVDRLLDVPEIH